MKKLLKMNIALLTSSHIRHKYIATKIAESLNVVLVVSEEKNAAITDTTLYNEEDRELINTHFEDRSSSEKHFFGDYSAFPNSAELISVLYKEVNSKVVQEALVKHKIDVILLFGSSIIKDDLLVKYPERIINLHLGLSPYYKGSGTNFFPIVNNEFECIGATFHLASSKVDAGNLLHQIRVKGINENDTIYSLGNKVIKEAGEIYPKIVMKYLMDEITPKSQKSDVRGNVYKVKDFTPQSIRNAKTVIQKGGLKYYLDNKTQIDNSKPIFSSHHG